MPLAAAARARAGRPAIKALHWIAIGELPPESGRNRLALKTRVAPFGPAQTESFFENEGPATLRRLIVDPSGAWVERDGKRTPLPARQAAHERAQYGLYGYLVALGAEDRRGQRRAHLTHSGLPPIDFALDKKGRPIEARYVVPAPSGAANLDQRIVFEEMIEDKGVGWPRRITILPAGAKPDQFSFRITIDQFTVELA